MSESRKSMTAIATKVPARAKLVNPAKLAAARAGKAAAAAGRGTAERWRNRLKQYSLRFHVLVIIAAVVGFATLVSHGLLVLGMEHPGSRYALVCLASYAWFCALIRIWIAIIASLNEDLVPKQSIASDSVDIGDAPNFNVSGAGTSSSSGGAGFSVGRGGDFAGGGAQGSWEPPVQNLVSTSSVGSSSGSSGGSGILNSLGDVVDLGDGGSDEGGFVIVALIAVLAVAVGGALVVIWIGPGLLVEAAIASFAAAGVTRKSVFEDQPAWWWVVIRKTWWILLAILVVSAWAGHTIEHHAPGVHTAREALDWWFANH